MLASPRASHQLKLLVIAVSFFFTAFYLFSGRSTANHQGYREIYKTAVSGKKAVFIEKFLANEVDGPFDNTTLVNLCETTQSTPGLIFQCESPEGGVGNVRNIVLNCVRYAIEAGATGLVIPEILIQTSKSETLTPVPFSHFFDTAYFTAALTSSCPQIRVYGHINDLYDLPSTAKPITLTASSLTKSFIADGILAAPGNWSASFSTFLNSSHPTPFSASKPILVKLSKPLLEFPLAYDGPGFIASFGRILRFREDTRRMAATILYALSTKYNLDLTPQIQKGKFYGAHLRTGMDATAAGWTPYEIQSANYLFAAEHLKLHLIYLVSGNPDDIYSFSEKAANMSIQVAHKELLLGGDQGKGAKGFEGEWADLKTLSWDQRLLVDYEVLLRSSSFGGTWESSLSWNLAMRRHIVNGDGKWMGLERPGETIDKPVPPPPAAAAGPAKTGPNLEKLPTNEGKAKNPNLIEPVTPAVTPAPAPEVVEPETVAEVEPPKDSPKPKVKNPKIPRPSQATALVGGKKIPRPGKTGTPKAPRPKISAAPRPKGSNKVKPDSTSDYSIPGQKDSSFDYHQDSTSDHSSDKELASESKYPPVPGSKSSTGEIKDFSSDYAHAKEMASESKYPPVPSSKMSSEEVKDSSSDYSKLTSPTKTDELKDSEAEFSAPVVSTDEVKESESEFSEPEASTEAPEAPEATAESEPESQSESEKSEPESQPEIPTPDWTADGDAVVSLDASTSAEVDTTVVEGSELDKRQTPPEVKSAVTSASKVGDTSFRDGLSVVFGPTSEGRRIMLSMWP